MKPSRYGVPPARHHRSCSHTVSGHGIPARFTAAVGTSAAKYYRSSGRQRTTSGVPTMTKTASSPCASATATAAIPAITAPRYASEISYDKLCDHAAARHTTRHADPAAHAISTRLDKESLRALRMAEAQGLRQSEAVRSPIVNGAERLRDHRALAARAAALETDEADRAEMAAVASLMGALGIRHEVSVSSPDEGQ